MDLQNYFHFSAAECYDEYGEENCKKYWVRDGFCKSNPKESEYWCKKSCGICKGMKFIYAEIKPY